MVRNVFRVLLAALVLLVASAATLTLFTMAATLGFAIFVSIPFVLATVPPLLRYAFELAGSLVRPVSRSTAHTIERREPALVASPPQPRAAAA